MTGDPQEVAARLARLVGARLGLEGVTGEIDPMDRCVLIKVARGCWYDLSSLDTERAMDAFGAAKDRSLFASVRFDAAGAEALLDAALAPLAERIAHECRDYVEAQP